MTKLLSNRISLTIQGPSAETGWIRSSGALGSSGQRYRLPNLRRHCVVATPDSMTHTFDFRRIPKVDQIPSMRSCASR